MQDEMQIDFGKKESYGGYRNASHTILQLSLDKFKIIS